HCWRRSARNVARSSREPPLQPANGRAEQRHMLIEQGAGIEVVAVADDFACAIPAQQRTAFEADQLAAVQPRMTVAHDPAQIALAVAYLVVADELEMQVFDVGVQLAEIAFQLD